MLTINFTDAQGVNHINALICVCRSSINKSADFSKRNEEEVTNFNLRYKAEYWTSVEAKDAGLASYPLADLETGRTMFNVRELGAEYDGLTALQAAEKHITEVVLA